MAKHLNECHLWPTDAKYFCFIRTFVDSVVFCCCCCLFISIASARKDNHPEPIERAVKANNCLPIRQLPLPLWLKDAKGHNANKYNCPAV